MQGFPAPVLATSVIRTDLSSKKIEIVTLIKYHAVFSSSHNKPGIA